ncbi:PucR family transcriptional regulator [Nitriliruptoraceae bacterium ZYF776]|nr:PucR family transcriptional regulator [Profundirhabdus halotolerans]
MTGASWGSPACPGTQRRTRARTGGPGPGVLPHASALPEPSLHRPGADGGVCYNDVAGVRCPRGQPPGRWAVVAEVTRRRGSRAAWQPIVALLDRLAGEPALVDEAVREVRAQVPAVGRLPAEDVARQTRALLAAAVRAIAERRGPSDAELAFIEQLAVTRADQQVPIDAVLTAIHLAGRRIWLRARAVAAELDIGPEQVLDARELFDDWSEQVRTRLLVSHRAAELARAASLRDRRVALLRRALSGGTAAPGAVGEAGLPAAGLWVVTSEPVDDADAGRMEPALRAGVTDLFGVLEGRLVGVLAARPESGEGPAVGVGCAGPVEAGRLDLAARWARLAVGVAGAGGAASGAPALVDVTDVPVAAALLGEVPLGRHLAACAGEGLAGEGEFAQVLCDTVVAFVERGAQVGPTAEALVVHPNTVRHRLRRFTAVTGLGLDDPFAAVAAWWLARVR